MAVAGWLGRAALRAIILAMFSPSILNLVMTRRLPRINQDQAQ